MTQVARIYLVRHGEASAHWTDATDPGLSMLGNEQARTVAKRLAPLGPLTIATSPLRRARETAAPLATAWQTAARIVAAVAEIPSPDIPIGERSTWLTRLMQGSWSSTDSVLHAWRGGSSADLPLSYSLGVDSEWHSRKRLHDGRTLKEIAALAGIVRRIGTWATGAAPVVVSGVSGNGQY